LVPSEANDGILFGEKLRGENGVGQVVAHVSDLTGCSATDLRRTLRHLQESVYGYSTLLVSEVSLGYFDEEQSSVSPIAFSLHEGELALEITFLVDTWDDDEEQAQFASSVLQPFLGHHRMRVLEVWQDEHYVEPPWPWHARIALTTRSRSLPDIYSVGKQAIALLHAVGVGGLNRDAVVHLVRAGHPEVLVGQREGPWLDVKEQHYDHATQAGQISTCQAISRFCNAEGGGVIVVGISTKKLPDGEEIRAIRPVPIGPHTVRRYRQAIERCLFPPPDNLSVESVLLGKEKGLILIDVPPQPEELKPFLVHGSIVDGKVQGTFISILRRRDDGSIPITAPMIHSTLAAGRALLRRGELPVYSEPVSGPDTATT
jgi:hypothetical protein